MKLRRIFWSADFMLALVTAAAVDFGLPYWVRNDLAKDYYGIGISVLSIVFSVFFAALAVIITASDDDFVIFLEETKDYSAIVSNFKASLGLLFAALLVSLGLYAYTASRVAGSVAHQVKYFVVLFVFIFFWSLFAAFNSTLDAIRYSDYRRKFVEAKRTPPQDLAIPLGGWLTLSSAAVLFAFASSYA